VPPTPLVIYVHGCAGLDADTERWAEVLTRAGYAMVAPDSLARGRRPRCDGRRPYPADDRDVLALRRSEVRYAVQQARTLPWVGEATIALLGFDQGGVVVAGDDDPAVGAYIITGWTCTAPDVRQGLFTPPDRPVLAIRWADDPMFADAAWNGDCGAHLGSRPGSRSIVLDGSGHSVADDPDAQEAVVRFLRAHTRR
jgi:hypothetical protein